MGDWLASGWNCNVHSILSLICFKVLEGLVLCLWEVVLTDGGLSFLDNIRIDASCDGISQGIVGWQGFTRIPLTFEIGCIQSNWSCLCV